jgi:hypothetical protein
MCLARHSSVYVIVGRWFRYLLRIELTAILPRTMQHTWSVFLRLRMRHEVDVTNVAEHQNLDTWTASRIYLIKDEKLCPLNGTPLGLVAGYAECFCFIALQ